MTLNRILADQADRLQAEALREAQFQILVENLARNLGYFAYHTHRSERSTAGYPDLTLVSPKTGRVVIAELKRQPFFNETTGRFGRRPVLTLEQRQWLDALSGPEVYMADRISVHLWLPLDYIRGLIGNALIGEPTEDTTWRARSKELTEIGVRSTWEPYRPKPKRRKR